jgi:CheY-like chemotaxis protein
LRVLAIDDDPIVLQSLRYALEQDGHTVETAAGGQAGIDAFREANARNEPFAAVITDLGMPYVDGRAVAAAIKSFRPQTPVILLTGWGQQIIADSETPANVDRVLAKPPKLVELRSALAATRPGPGEVMP